MRRYTNLFICLWLLGVVLTCTARGAAEDVDLVVKKANLAAYYQGDNGKATVTMTITDKKGQTRNRAFVILRQDVEDGGDQKYFVYFKRPSDVRRMTYMVHKHAAVDKDDDRWLYLPALSLVKRIAAGDKRTSFVGSDFLYEDVSGRSLEEDVHELTETTEAFYVIKSTPKNPASVEFSYFTVAIDKANFIPMKMEFFDKTGARYRVIESTEVKEIQGYPTVVKSLVKDLKTGSQTEMAFTDVAYDIKLKDIFTERYLSNPPRDITR
jgi:outer membrane lipoprotein-sorting protein